MNSSEEAEKAQQELLQTSSGQIELMTGNWQIFVDNIIDSDAIFNVLNFINDKLKEINTRMNFEKALDDGVKEIAKSGFAMVGRRGELTMSQFLFGMSEDEFLEKNKGFWEDLRNMNETELADMGKNLTAVSNEYNIIKAKIDETQALIDKNRSMAKAEGAPFFYSEHTQKANEYETQLKTLQQSLFETTQELGRYGIQGSEVNEVLDFIADNTYRLITGFEDTGDAIDESAQELTAYDYALNGIIDLTADGTSQMLSDYEYFSDEKKKVIVDAFNTEISALKGTISAYDAYMQAIKEPTKYLNRNKLFAIVGEEAARMGEDFDIEGTITRLNKLQSELDGLLDSDSGDGSSSSKKLSEPLSQLEIQIRDLQHEIKLLDDELKRTTGYDEQIRITNLLIDKKEQEKLKLEELAESQKTEYQAMKKNSALRQDAVGEYQKTVEAIGKVSNEIYAYEESLVDLSKTQEEVVEKSINDSVKRMRDDYSEMFDELKDKYKDEADEFEKQQDKKIRAVEKTIDRLRDKYDEEDFVDEEEEIQDRILELEEERQMLSIDNSLEAQKRKFEIGQELETEEKTLAELRQERERELTLEGLEDKKEAYEEETRVYKENLDERLKDLERFEDDVMDNLNNFESTWETFGEDLGKAFKDGLLPSLQSINSELNKTIQAYNETTDSDIKTPDVDVSGDGTTDVNRGTKTRYVDPSGNIQTGYIKDGRTTTATGGDIPLGSVVETAGGNYQKTATGSKLRNDIDINDYIRHNGGVVGGKSFAGNGFMDYMNNLSGSEMPIIAEQGEVVLTPSQKGQLNNQGNTASFESLIQINNPQIGGNYNDISDFSKKLATDTNEQLAKLGIVNIGRN